MDTKDNGRPARRPAEAGKASRGPREGQKAAPARRKPAEDPRTARKAGAAPARRKPAGSPRPAQEEKQAAAQRRTAGKARPAQRTEAAKKAEQARRTRTASAGRTGRRTSPPPRKVKRPTPDVVYMPPKPFSRNRLLLRLATVAAVVLALTLGMSIFFKVGTVTVSGSEKYTPWMIMEASGIREGDNLLTLSKPKISGKIISSLPYVESVRVGIRLPDTVHIEIKELDVVYAAKDTAGKWWALTSAGRVVEQVDGAKAGECTKLLGFTLDAPQVGQTAKAWEAPAETDAEGETVPAAALNRDRLSAALNIAEYLEQNNIIGQAVSVNTEDLYGIELWYGDRFQVLLGDTTGLSYKISSMKAAIDSLPGYESGVLDASYTIVKDQIMYTRFD